MTAKLVKPNRAELSSPSKTTKLVFHCYGKDQCFLYQIWVEGTRRGTAIPEERSRKRNRSETPLARRPRDRIRALSIKGCQHGKGTPKGVPF